jgi:hypothetical protein
MTMKKAIVVLSVIFLASCEKMGMHDRDDDDNRTCECVANESVPSQVQSGFKTKYPQLTADKWFNKDDNGYAAVFTQNGTKMLSEFDNNGTFKMENVAPPASTPPSGPNGQHPEHHGKCGHPHHKPMGLFGMGHHKHHGNCQHHDDEKKRDCQVQLAN